MSKPWADCRIRRPLEPRVLRIAGLFVVGTATLLLFYAQVKNFIPVPRQTMYTKAAEKEQETPRTHQIGRDKRRIPNVLLAGEQKAGTSFISSWLLAHDDVCGPEPIPDAPDFGDRNPKELHFFDPWKRFRKGIGFYRSRWVHCRNTTYILDATPDYLRYAERLRPIYDEQGTGNDLKIIISLREPVAREISFYNMFYNKQGGSNQMLIKKPEGGLKTFEEFVDSVFLQNVSYARKFHRDSFYSTHLRQLFADFDRKQILVLSFDELKSDPDSLFDRIHRFLGLAGDKLVFGEGDGTRHVSQSAAVAPCSLQEQLAQVFEPYNAELYELLDQNPGPEMEQRPFPKFKRNCTSH